MDNTNQKHLTLEDRNYIKNIGDNMNSKYKQCLLKSKYTFQIMRNNESYIEL